MSKKKISTGFVLGVSLVSFFVGVTFVGSMVLLGSFSVSSKIASKLPQAEACDASRNGVTRPGWQCYYQDMPDGTRKGTWIVPDFFRLSLDAKMYQPYLSGWTRYTSPKGEISFLYPAKAWEINALNYKNDAILGVLMGKPADMPPTITIGIQEKNGVSMEESMNQDMAGAGRADKQAIILNGADGFMIRTVSSVSIGQNAVALYFDRGAYYVRVGAPIFYDPAYDFATATLLSSIKVK